MRKNLRIEFGEYSLFVAIDKQRCFCWFKNHCFEDEIIHIIGDCGNWPLKNLNGDKNMLYNYTFSYKDGLK